MRTTIRDISLICDNIDLLLDFHCTTAASLFTIVEQISFRPVRIINAHGLVALA